MSTLAKLFDSHTDRLPDSLAYAWLTEDLSLDQSTTYAELRHQVGSAAAWIAETTRPGDRVLLAFPPGLDFVLAFWACIVAGRVAVPVAAPDPHRLHQGAPRLRSVIVDSRAALVLTTEALLDAASAALDPSTFTQARWMALPARDRLGGETQGFERPVIDSNTLAYLQYTSGSTSTPRGVRITHGNVMANVASLIEATHAGRDTRVLNWLPHFHDYGLVFGVIAPFVAGGCSILMSPMSFLRRPRRWLEAIEAQRITHCGAPGSAYAACIQALGGQPYEGNLTSLVSLTCGAEPIRPEMVDDLLAAFGQAGLRPGVFMPCYGLAESVLGVTIGGQRPQPLIVEADAEALQANRFEEADPASPRAGRRLVGCGRPLPGVALEIVDPTTGQRASSGAVGEIWVHSPSVGGGYWMQAEATQAVFGGRLDGAEGSAWLRTGDLGFVHESELFITGRMKDLIIVHGENHYPQDIEWTAERAHADLRPNHGIAFSVDAPEGEGIVLALELARRTAEPDPQAIFLDVRRALAVEHALPLHTLLLCRAGTLPRTSSGKLQRAQCRALFLSGALAAVAQFRGDGHAPQLEDESGARRAQQRSAQVMPKDEVEQAIWQIWREVLGTPSFGVNESFFELGGSSLRMTQVLSRINARFHVELPLADVFEHASVAALAEQIRMRLDSVRSGAVAAVPPPGIERVARGVPVPASLSQRRMWVIQHFDPASTAYNVPIAIRVRGAFDRAVCQQALDLMIERHEGLRTCFVMRDEPMQWIEPRLSVPIEWIDLSHLPEAQRNAHARELLAHRLSQPFDLSMAPLHRPTLLRLGEREHVLFWLIHHAIVDNWSAALLMREALVAYGELLDGRSPPSTPPEVEYADYAAWQRRPESVEARKPHLAYWTDKLRGLPDLDLPTEFPRPAKASFKGARVSADLPARLREAMRQFETREAVTPFVVYLAAFVLMLSRQARSEDVAVGTPIANRHRFASEMLLGTLVNTLVMRTDLSGDPSFTELVHRVRKNALEAHAHQDAPFDELIDALGHDRAAQPQGPVRVLFNVLNAPVGRLDFRGLEIDEFDFERTAAQFDLSMHIDTEFSHRVHLEYATDLFTALGAERQLENYLALVEQLLQQPERPVSECEMVAPVQMSLLRHGWNGAKSPLAGELLVHRLLHLDDPGVRDRIAVIDADGASLTFGDVDALSNGLAHALRQRGIARGQRVGLCIPRSPDMLIAELAVMKSGAAYVPLDPEYPVDRLRFMAVDAELSAVLTHEASSAIVDGLDIPTLRLDDEALMRGQPEHALVASAELDATPSDEAYVIYTSGSTGQPKGVRMPHRGVVNFLHGMVKMPGLTSDDCLVAITSPSFDPSVLDLMLPLLVRARVVIASHAQAHDPTALRGLLERHRATLMQATPSAWRMLIDTGWMGSPTFRALIGGEALPPALAERLMERTGELWNIYGPTETTVWTTAWRVQAPRDGISIGRPIDNTSVWVLDEHGMACPIGVPGELYIGGVGVAPGYWHRDELTAERFIPDPFSDTPGDRLYRTGDLGRWRHDGLLEHLGRADHQVKLRGHRVEMGEIESALLDHLDVAHCVAVTREETEGDVRLVAYVVARDHTTPTATSFRDHLRARLPDYMIPQHFVLLDVMPQLPNGKVNRAALPAPAVEAVLADGRGYLPPETHSERVIADIWAELLGVPDISRTDNFFDLGGHSLLAMRAVTATEAMLGWKIAPRRLIYESLQQVAREENLATSPV